jgi:hypothetical protein
LIEEKRGGGRRGRGKRVGGLEKKEGNESSL